MDLNVPFLIAGPILRKATRDELVLWLVTSEKIEGFFELSGNNGFVYRDNLLQSHQIQVGERCFITLGHFKGDFPTDTPLYYDLTTQYGTLSSLCPELLFPNETQFTIKISTQADYILHGSCRNPHHTSGDALVQANKKVALQPVNERPDMLIMGGDQIYADHVSGPMLHAIFHVIEMLGLPEETFHGAPVHTSQELRTHPNCYYARHKLLPSHTLNSGAIKKLLGLHESPIFSSREAENHLVSFSEHIAMYLLTWSPSLWHCVESKEDLLSDKEYSSAIQQKWKLEKANINQFVSGLIDVQSLLAHIPTYMIFDDHDVTDDWNLTVGWEKAAYNNPFAKRIIGNALIAYWLCQGWGNEPNSFNTDFMQFSRKFLSDFQPDAQDKFINYLLRFERWHYVVPTTPKVVVLDTRTRRWRSESKLNKPSGLMDWEALTEFQQELLEQDKIIVVSPAPMFGVKFIETLQRVATKLGQPLLIDAENWMAHPGSANSLISIFTHTKTPSNFVILSGDVHYSFAYDIKVRSEKNSPNIYQITCSGIKNQFPEPLLSFCDHLDSFLYSPRSPLNYFTKRKRLKVYKRQPNWSGKRKLINMSCIGEVRLDNEGKPKKISILASSGDEWDFPPIDKK
ncbi:hypothetical protein [Vibrio caribbeanicus]|uniref:PhoD-like phosphatase metallophosphatase domain-containing protein n=1 Tax=Vibrio caribbeanicus ATCC BAA-2122 TaxID=796620 RepID=E3BKY7_9VIBR|nr:hypothetical protein [Vibrio caribbeanicus]EFP96331.1 hypothetical protein VIBC2010_12219 [Vibrio caribbeanicus ATCC BAA-2122]